MALSIPRLSNDLFTGLSSLYTRANMLANQGDARYTLRQWADIIATSVINEFTNHAQCNGLDSHNDTHGNVGII